MKSIFKTIFRFIEHLKQKKNTHYQEVPHSENTTSPHSQEEEKKREHGL
jgi:hypothetical protein